MKGEKMKYIYNIRQFLRAIAEQDRMEMLAHLEELGNLLMDKVPISDAEAEIADTLADEIDMDFNGIYDE
jgi:hypothetical protein